MFKFNYIITPVNEEKNIYSLRPTFGALVKAFAPTLVLFAGLVAMGVYSAYEEKKLKNKKPETPQEDI